MIATDTSIGTRVVLSRFGGAPMPGKKAFPKIPCSLAMRLIEGPPRYVEVGSPLSQTDHTAAYRRLVQTEVAISDQVRRIQGICTDRVCGVLTDFQIEEVDGVQEISALLTPTGKERDVLAEYLGLESEPFMNARLLMNADGEIVDIVTWDLNP